MRWLIAGLWVSLIAGCNNEEGTSLGTSGGGSGSGGSAAKPAAGGGFSADLAKELATANGSGSGGGAAKAGDGSAAAMAGTGSGSGSAKAMAGSGDGSAAKAGDGSAVAMAGSGSGSGAKAGDGSAAKAGDGSAAKVGTGSAAKVAAGDGSAAKAGDGSAAKVGTGSAAKTGDGSAKAPDPAPKISTGPGPVIQASGTVPKRVVVPAELAAIKLSLGPNWDRDVLDAGTISLGVKIPGRTDSAIFVFRYGYEDSSAPADRDAYKKWLAEKKLLVIRQDRQAGAAWFLEGTDGSGNAAFRVVVNWGGRKLICYGSLYKDGESNKLGDLRDQTIIQAKQICETVAL